MGADLYIEKLHEADENKYRPKFEAAVAKRDKYTAEHDTKNAWDSPVHKALQKQVMKYFDLMMGDKGYFRDSYNASGIAKALGFSWWKDVVPMLDKDGNLTGKNLHKFLGMVSGPMRELTAKDIRGYGGKVDNRHNSVKAWNESYKKRQQDLIAFVKRAIELGEPINCSL